MSIVTPWDNGFHRALVLRGALSAKPGWRPERPEPPRPGSNRRCQQVDAACADGLVGLCVPSDMPALQGGHGHAVPEQHPVAQHGWDLRTGGCHTR